jgi:predicted permease
MNELRQRLRILFRRGQFHSELEEEMQSHLEMQAEENEANGMDPGEARYTARRQFGNATLLKESSRDAWGWRWIETLGHDFRLALRTLRRRPGFTATAILSLALGIGANTAIFSLIHSVLLRTLPVPEPEKLVSIYHRNNRGMLCSSSYPDYMFYRDNNDVFAGMLAFLRLPMLIRTGAANERVSAELASDDYFSVLELEPAAGRWFSALDEEPSVVLSYEFWQRRFNGDPAVIGTSLEIGEGVFTVSGIAPRGFRGLVFDWGDPPALWIPVGMYRRAVPAFGNIDVLNSWGMQSFLVAGRLKPGVALDKARAALAVLSSRAETFRNQKIRFSPELFPTQQARFWPEYRGSVKLLLALLATLAGLVLLITCLNLANLLLARASQRQKEIAIRLSIGSSRARLIRQFLTESLVLSLIGGAAGLLVARWIAAYLSIFQGVFKIPLALDTSLYLPVLVFAFLLSVATGVAFGLIPAAQAARFNVATALKSESPRSKLHGTMLRDGLVIVQVTLSAILLAGAGLFLRTVQNARSEDVTTNPDKVLVTTLDTAILGYDASRSRVVFPQVLDRVRALPGVERAALVSFLPLGGMRGGTDIDIGGRKIQADYNVATEEYFDTIGLPLVRGRAFADRDREGAPAVAVINDVMARQFWPGQQPLGKRFKLTWTGGGDAEVIGVVRDGKFSNFRETHRPCFYIPLAQQGRRQMYFAVRGAANPTGLTAAIRREVRAIDGNVSLTEFSTLQWIRERGISQERLIASLLTAFGALALALAAIGIYGVMAFSVAQRTQEIGIRMALGANAGQIAGTVVRKSVALTLAGLTIGVAGGLALSRFIASMLYGVSPADARVFAGAAVVLFTAAVLAGYIPARRAAKLNPIEALRHL